MKYDNLIVVDIAQLDEDQIRLGIKIEARHKWEDRLRHLAHEDWKKAWSRLRTKDNPFPRDEEIRPVAHGIYLNRIRGQLLADWNEAVERLKKDGNPYPSEGEIRWLMDKIAAERNGKEKMGDWLEAEEEILRLGVAWVPLSTEESKKSGS
jgi:hypothetical protein